MIGKLNTLAALVVNKLYIFSAYTLGAYILLGVFCSLLSDLSVTSLKILFGIGLSLAAIMMVPAIMATDSEGGIQSILFSGTIFSYPFIYLLSLLASRWIPGIAGNDELSLIAALPLINVIVMVGLIAAAFTIKK